METTIFLQVLHVLDFLYLDVATEQKYGAGQNKHTVTSMNTAKLDRETEELKHDKIDLSVGKLIQKGRNAKEWTQKV